MTFYISKASADDTAWAYPLPQHPHKEGHLVVSEKPFHEMYWAEYGNPDGEPVFVIHGGPGGGSSPQDARFFNPQRYRIILFDQRGCGQSRPHVAKDPRGGLADNDTPHLIEDINTLRQALRVKGKMHVFGGSWGSTLAMAYAIAHPEHVQSLVLRGIFLVRKSDLDYFYQGNATTYHQDPFEPTQPGTYVFFPDAWKEFVEVIPREKRDDMIKSYAAIFNHEPKNSTEKEFQIRALMAWTKWEGMTSYLSPGSHDLGKFNEMDFAMAFARIENHYFMNGCFLGGRGGESSRENNYLLEKMTQVITQHPNMPIRIIQGQYDQVCPRFGADVLVDALQKAGATDLQYILPPAGHSRLERDIIHALTMAMDTLPKMT